VTKRYADVSFPSRECLTLSIVGVPDEKVQVTKISAGFWL
jgi:hypothetical protein